MNRSYDYGFVQFGNAHDIPTIPTRSLRQTSATLAAHPTYAFGNYMLSAPPPPSFVREDTTHITARLLQDRLAADGDHDLQSNVWYQPGTTPERDFWHRIPVPIHAPIPVTPTRRPLAGLGISFGQPQDAAPPVKSAPTPYFNKSQSSASLVNLAVTGPRSRKRKASVLHEDDSPMAVDPVPPASQFGEVAAYSTCPSQDYAARSSFDMLDDPSPFCVSYSPTDDVLMLADTPLVVEPLGLPRSFAMETPDLAVKNKPIDRMMDIDSPTDDGMIGIMADVNFRAAALAAQPSQLCVNPADLSMPTQYKLEDDEEMVPDLATADTVTNTRPTTGPRWASPDMDAAFPDDAVTAIVSVLAASAKDETTKTDAPRKLYMPAPALPQHMGQRQGLNIHPSAFPSRSAYGLGIQFSGHPAPQVNHASGPMSGPPTSAFVPRIPLAPISNQTNNALVQHQQAPVLNAHEGVDLDDLRLRADTFRMLNPGCELDKTFLQAFAGRLSERGELLSEFRCYVTGCSQRNKRRDHILVHVGSHVEHRPFQCPQCGMRFLRKNECKRHMSSHGGFKPFTCTMCAPYQVKSFVRQDLLKRHMKVTHGVMPEQWPDRRRRKMDREEVESPVVDELMYPDDCMMEM